MIEKWSGEAHSLYCRLQPPGLPAPVSSMYRCAPACFSAFVAKRLPHRGPPYWQTTVSTAAGTTNGPVYCSWPKSTGIFEHRSLVSCPLQW